jgi:hypothetical protein
VLLEFEKQVDKEQKHPHLAVLFEFRNFRGSGVQELQELQTIVLKALFASVYRGWKYCLNSRTPVTPELHQLAKVE